MPKERRLVASVIYNRLRDDISLGIDATVRFITGNWTRAAQAVRARQPEPLQHARPHGPAARADRQPGPGRDPRRGQPGAHGLPLLRRGGLRQRRATSSPRRTPSSSATSTSTTPRATSAAASRRRTVEHARGRPRLPRRAQPLARDDERGVRRARARLALPPPAGAARAVRGDGARAAGVRLPGRQRDDPAQARRARARGRADRGGRGDRSGQHARSSRTAAASRATTPTPAA